MPPPIPPITAPDLIEAVSALTRAADSYRKAFLLLAHRLLVAGGGEELQKAAGGVVAGGGDRGGHGLRPMAEAPPRLAVGSAV
jgi:hypothetical protein